MKWIVDCGSSKADWIDLESGNSFKTIGWNSALANQETIEERLDEVTKVLGRKVESIWFYGAGCMGEKQLWLQKIIENKLNCNASVDSDLIAAARATCGHNEGIACIIGTGSNSCKWNGKAIVEHTSPLGYILGDEGSGAVIGKRLIGDYLKGQLSGEIHDALEMSFGIISEEEAIKRVYREVGGNRWLASFVPFLKKHLDDCYCYNLVCDEFVRFIERNVLQYKDAKEMLVNFVGGVANGFSEVLEVAAEETGIHIGVILNSPMEGLIRWHKEE